MASLCVVALGGEDWSFVDVVVGDCGMSGIVEVSSLGICGPWTRVGTVDDSDATIVLGAEKGNLPWLRCQCCLCWPTQ